MTEFEDDTTNELRSTGAVTTRCVPTTDVAGVTLWVDGEIDHATAPGFAASLAPLIDGGGHVRVDLSGVTFMSSAGVHVLDDATIALGDRGDLVVVDPARPVRRVLTLLDAHHVVVVDHVVEADGVVTDLAERRAAS